MKTISIKVQPKAKKESVEKIDNDHYRVKVAAAPEKGQANKRLIAMMAKELQVPKSKISIIQGAAARQKLIRVVGGFIVAIMLVSGMQAVAETEPVVVEATVDRSTITIGDRINYTLTITHDKAVTVDYPELAVQLGEFEIKDFSLTGPDQDKDGSVTVIQHYLISTFVTGSYTIPALTITYHDAAGEEKTVSSQDIIITVESVTGDEPATDIRPLKDPAGMPADRRWVWWLLGIVLIAGAIGGGSAWFIHRRAQTSALPPEPVYPPEIIARQALAALEASSLIAEGKVKEYFDKLSDIVRGYIEGRFRIFALDRTTAELYSQMRARRFTRGHIELIKQLLDTADLVKFARMSPTRQESEQALACAREIVEVTTPKQEQEIGDDSRG